ncbi:MAG: DUF5107 domain-containing protein [Lachnospiraceae bacterium]|nr:DUF5107 domain-containing protein [Lachnospiraceae bacterium]
MGEVKIWEEKVVIPTYETGLPDKNPMFLEKRVYQGSSGKIYPYPSTNDISREKKDKVWNVVFLENDYIKVMIMPELGGRIQRAYDKTNDYDFVYYNHVIKPALVGLTGPWISGGIEFNWPQHHRPTTYCPVDHKIIENSDGSKTLLTGDVDQMYGTKENTAFTLYPDRAYIEIEAQLYNRTPLPQTFLWWANPAVSVNDHTQSVFPPDVHNVYDHGKRAVSRFPIATGEYYKYDYSEGVDISRYKNIPVPTSYMAEKSDYDFVGGYDYQKKAGLLHVADHHVSPGKKQWTWGCGDFGKAWDRNLTDEDGPYIELMTGMYCDNQPDFSWLKPYEEKRFRQYFMPYKAAGYVKNAGIDAALNVEVREGGVLYVCVYATGRFEDGRIAVEYDGKKIYEEEAILSPVDIYEKELLLGIDDCYRVNVSVFGNGKKLISYMPKDLGIPKIAEPAKAASRPEEIKTNEELYLTGQHIEQYRHATWLPDPYYIEGLKRDKYDVRINNAYGLLLLRRGEFEEAEKYFRKALIRLTSMHPNPCYSEPYYNLGLTLFYMEKYDDAYEAFYKATWVSELQEMSFYFLSAIKAREGEWEEALMFIEKALVKNSHNVKARGLKAAILFKMGDVGLDRCIEENLEIDPFDFVSMFIGIRGKKDSKDTDLSAEFGRLSRNFSETFLRVARDLAEYGLYEEALDALKMFSGDNALIHYYLGAYYKKLDEDKKALEEFIKGEKSDPAYCFPNKLEDIAVLDCAIEMLGDKESSKAMYYLGCLYYDKLGYSKAVKLWEGSERSDDNYPTLLRNLSIAYYNKLDRKEEARRLLERAFELDTGDARIFLELDQLYQKLSVPKEDRLLRFEENKELIEKRDDLYTEYVTLLNSMGKYEEAYRLISGHEFRTWEGAEGKITTQFKVCLVEQAKDHLEKGDAKRALDLLLEALSYPENLGEGRLEGTKDNNIYYYIGRAYDILGDNERAIDSYKKATLGAMEVAGMMYYYDQPADMILYQGLAKERLGDIKAANARYYKLLDFGEMHLEDEFEMDYFAVSMPDMSVFDADMTRKNRAHCYYVMGLACIGLKRGREAVENLERVLCIDSDHQNAGIYLKMAKNMT